MAQSKIPPLIVGLAVVLVIAVVGVAGRGTHDANATRIAHISRTRAVLNDGSVTFAAAVTLSPNADAWKFDRKQDEMRQALIAILRTKSRYMVSNPTAREALRRQMLREVNRVMAAPAADEIRFTEFVLS
jgi:flagellar basal body-associated protein FliL